MPILHVRYEVHLRSRHPCLRLSEGAPESKGDIFGGFLLVACAKRLGVWMPLDIARLFEHPSPLDQKKKKQLPFLH